MQFRMANVLRDLAATEPALGGRLLHAFATAFLTLSLTGCANHPALRNALIATAIASVAATDSDHQPNDGRVLLSPDPCVPDPARCK